MSQLVFLPPSRTSEVGYVNKCSRSTTVYLSGWTRNLNDWRNQSTLAHTNFLSVNLPGVGKSSPTLNQDNYFQGAAYDLLDTLMEIKRNGSLGNIHLVAHSMGALVAYEFLSLTASGIFNDYFPKSLTLVTPTFDDPRKTAPSKGLFLAPSFVSSMRITAFEKLVSDRFQTTVSKEAQKSLTETFALFERLGPLTFMTLLAPSYVSNQFSQFVLQARKVDIELASYTLNQMLIHGPKAAERFKSGQIILPPYVLMLGGKYDTFVDFGKALAIIQTAAKSSTSKVKSHLFENAGHFPQLEIPYEFNPELRSFIMDVERNLISLSLHLLV